MCFFISLLAYIFFPTLIDTHEVTLSTIFYIENFFRFTSHFFYELLKPLLCLNVSIMAFSNQIIELFDSRTNSLHLKAKKNLYNGFYPHLKYF